MLRATLIATLAFTATAFAQKGDPFAEGVRTTEPLTPAEQRGKFKLPHGFEIQLVAAEPELRKPMNMAFDATGRLWVSESREYPFPAKDGAEKRDSIRIFSNFGPDGRARKMEIFADGLNIPIGLYPFRTGDGHWKCIAWSIPNIWLFEDTDGDGKADKRDVLFGPLGWEKDTHGNQASFRRGDDGWLYATHGFNNHSVFKAKDGSTITLNSGNTYRFRVDGSRIEQWTHGQVNPYGLCWDDRGNLFSADCHSSPIYQLLRGGEYPSFGKPHTGLGFAPQTIQHSHGSTAICGPMLIRDTSWPAELQGHMLVGNVMTSRINRDHLSWHGSSSKGKEMPDFLTSEDPWFRPVDLQWGPDGALYIADFYNRIIGHYEVPLQHPGRDRERGRIWRVIYKGEGKTAAAEGVRMARPEDVSPENRLDSEKNGLVEGRDLLANRKNKEVFAKDKEVFAGDKEVFARDKGVFAKDEEVFARDEEVFARDEEVFARDEEVFARDKGVFAGGKGGNARDEHGFVGNGNVSARREAKVVSDFSRPSVASSANDELRTREVSAERSRVLSSTVSPTKVVDYVRPSDESALLSEAPSSVPLGFGVRGLDPALTSTGESVELQTDATDKADAGLSSPENPTTSEANSSESQSGVKPPHSKASRHSHDDLASVAPDSSLPKEEQIAALIKELGSPNPTRRSLALNEICDRFPNEAALPLARNRSAIPACDWALSRIARVGALPNFSKFAPGYGDPIYRTHRVRIAAEKFAKYEAEIEAAMKQELHTEAQREFFVQQSKKDIAANEEFVRNALNDPDAIVRRVATEATALHPTPASFTPLLTLLRTTDKADDHLIYSTRLALREHLRDSEVVKALKLDGLSREALQAVLDIMPAVPGEHAALLRLDLFTKLDVSAEELAKQLPSIIKNAPADRLESVALLARKKLATDTATLTAILDAHDARGVPPGEVLSNWVAAMVPQLLIEEVGAWDYRSDRADQKSPFALQQRKTSDDQTHALMSSFPGGESATGILRSAPFAAPERLRFYLCGHDGTPQGAPGKKNFVRLVDADGKPLREAAPPRNDVAQRIEWDLADVRGKMVRFEATDGDSGGAYAWLAFGRFKPELPQLTLASAAGKNPRAVAADFAGRFDLQHTAERLAILLGDRAQDIETRAAAARSLAVFRNNLNNSDTAKAWVAQIARILASAETPDALREQLAATLGRLNNPPVGQLVADAMPTATAALQQKFAAALTTHGANAKVLLAAVESGKASPHVLRDKATVDRLRAAVKSDELKRLDALLAKLPPANVEADKLIAARRTAYKGGDATKGASIFQTHCAACHQIGQVGSLVGPQLDGVGSRGLDRILEDILDPNRNVDRAFRMTLVTLNDGSLAAGLFRREEGAQLILADVTGKEQTIPLAQVKKREEQDTSLMPPVFGASIPAEDFNALLAFLLSQKATK